MADSHYHNSRKNVNPIEGSEYLIDRIMSNIENVETSIVRQHASNANKSVNQRSRNLKDVYLQGVHDQATYDRPKVTDMPSGKHRNRLLAQSRDGYTPSGNPSIPRQYKTPKKDDIYDFSRPISESKYSQGSPHIFGDNARSIDVIFSVLNPKNRSLPAYSTPANPSTATPVKRAASY